TTGPLRGTPLQRREAYGTRRVFPNVTHATVAARPEGRFRDSFCRQNSFPSGSRITIQKSPSSAASFTSVAPRATARSASARTRSTLSWPCRPAPTFTSRCIRLLAVLGSGTFWMKMRGPAPSGSLTAFLSFHRSSGRPRAVSASSHDAKPSGGASRTYPRTAHQNSPSARGSAASNVTWNVFAIVRLPRLVRRDALVPAPARSGRRRLHLPQLLLEARDLVAQARGHLELQLGRRGVHLVGELLDELRQLARRCPGEPVARRGTLLGRAGHRGARPTLALGLAAVAVPAREQLLGVQV